MPAKSDKVWADAISRAISGYDEQKDETGKVRKIRWLNVLALQLVQSAAKGDITAMKEIGDRLDGKPLQTTDNNVKFNGPVKVELVKID